MEGIGYDFIPRVLDRKVVDDWVKVDDTMALPMARRLIREEGMFCGGSSGAVLSCAIKYLKENNIENKLVVVILADNLRNYITKLVQREWMVDKGFMEPSEIASEKHKLKGRPLDDFELPLVQHYDANLSIAEAWSIFE
jgi:cystathionine beta-synthase